ncbi:hypothetical protein FBR02_08350 [Anaerolineae bacterium CFX9]|nr:hypothetical protein [Anaerolineae bacterium CFX9]
MMSHHSEDDTPRDTARPQFVVGRSGTRRYSLAALVERVVEAFHLEYDPDSPTILEADTSARRLKLIVDVADYVFAVESIVLLQDERASIIERAYSELFGYGPLDALLLDPSVTTISIRGSRQTSVRYGHRDLHVIGQIFDDDEHLQRIVDRLLIDAGVHGAADSGMLETGLTVRDRRLCLNLILPPLSYEVLADIRVHPAEAPSFDSLVSDGFMSSEAADLIRRIVRSKYGIAIVGEPETGKTTLLNALCSLLPEAQSTISVERAAELQLPAGMRRHAAAWNREENRLVTFGEQISRGLLDAPTCLLLDEVRADEPHAIAPLLDLDDVPRQIWVVRGAPDAKRLQSALGMLARRAAYGAGERLVHRLYERLPFVLTVARIRERLQLFSIAEWQARVDTDYPDYVMLMRYQEGQARSTDAQPARWLD